MRPNMKTVSRYWMLQRIQCMDTTLGNTNMLEEEPIPFFGDQLTRVRLQGAKQLQTLSVDRVKWFEDIGPFVCTLWHNKQDFLHKAYKRLWTKNTGRDRGTLYYFKVLLRRTHVIGKVKNNYNAQEDLFLLVGEMLIMEQCLEYMGMDTYDSVPSQPAIPANIARLGKQQKVQLADQILLGFLHRYNYGLFSLEQHQPSTINPPVEQQVRMVQTVVGRIREGFILVSQKMVPTPKDEVMGYSSNFCHWALHLMHLNDTATEGDIDRTVLGMKASIPFFYSHSKLSKYFVENVDLLLKTTIVSSPRMKMRLLEGSYINTHGGAGQNTETDLVMEWSVRNRKDVIQQLGPSKNENSIIRSTQAADTIDQTTRNFSAVLNTRIKSSFHSKQISEEDRQKVKRVLRQLRPFSFQAGRKFGTQPDVTESPFTPINLEGFRAHLRTVIVRLCRGQIVEVEDDDA